MVSEISKIQDYAIIGDSRSAALVSKRGSIDWLCWPRFDSPSVFGAIIDPDVGGCWSIRPTNDFQVSRRYIDKTNVLETTFTNGSARIVLIDFMAVTSEDTKRELLWPEHELHPSKRRRIRALQFLGDRFFIAQWTARGSTRRL